MPLPVASCTQLPGLPPRSTSKYVLTALREAKGEDFITRHIWQKAVLDQDIHKVLCDGRFFAESFEHWRPQLRSLQTAEILESCFHCANEDYAILNYHLLVAHFQSVDVDFTIKFTHYQITLVAWVICEEAHLRSFDLLQLQALLGAEGCSDVLRRLNSVDRQHPKWEARCQLFLRLASMMLQQPEQKKINRIHRVWSGGFQAQEAIPRSVRLDVVTQLASQGLVLAPPTAEPLLTRIQRGGWSRHMALGTLPSSEKEVNDLINATLHQNSLGLLTLIFDGFQRAQAIINWNPQLILKLIHHKQHRRLKELVRWIIQNTDAGTRLLASRRGPYLATLMASENFF